MVGRRGQEVGAALAALTLLGVLVADLVSSKDIVLSVFFALAPLIACAVLPPLRTALYGVVATGLAIAAGSWNHTWGMAQQYVRVSDVAVMSSVAVVVSSVRVRRERRQARLVEIAEAAQRAVLPILPPRVNQLGIAARYVSAAEDALVGGDFYDIYHSDHCVRLLIGDVRGKGLEAIEHAARVIRAFRQSAASSEDLGAVAKEMNDYLVPFFSDEEFATAVLLHVEDDRRLTLVNCGHPPPLLVGTRSTRPIEGPPNLPLGMGNGYASHDVSWGPGDRLLLYTDGLIEARDRRGRFLPIEDIAGCLDTPGIDESLQRLLEVVTGHAAGGRLADDLALVLLENVARDPGLTPRHPTA